MKIIILVLMFFSSVILSSEISFSRSETNFSIRDQDGDKYCLLTFRKTAEDSVFNYLKYSSCSKKGEFVHELAVVDSLWKLAQDSIKIYLTAADLGYPLEFKAKIKEYIQTFLDSEEWMEHVSVNGKTLNYEIMRKVILENEIYPEIDELFCKHGYNITGINTEKHGFVIKNELIKYGFKGDEIIPVPFMLYWKLERIKKIDN